MDLRDASEGWQGTWTSYSTSVTPYSTSVTSFELCVYDDRQHTLFLRDLGSGNGLSNGTLSNCAFWAGFFPPLVQCSQRYMFGQPDSDVQGPGGGSNNKNNKNNDGEGGNAATKAWIKEAGRMNHLKHIVP